MILTLSVLLVACSNDHPTEKEVVKESIEQDAESIYTISAEEAYHHLNQETHVFVDTRINDAYNGWALDGVLRGGHIPSAMDFSSRWLELEEPLTDEEIRTLLEERGITEDKHVILYDVNGHDALTVQSMLLDRGFKSVEILDLNSWAENDYPLVKHPNYHLIVPAVIVNEVIQGKVPETFENAQNIKVVEASWGEEKTSYAKGHVPGTFHINTDSIEPPPAWMLADSETLNDFALEHGFTSSDTVIVTSADYLAAYRVATVLKYIGVEDVRVLNGGLNAWIAEGFAVETERHDPVPVDDFGTEIPGRDQVIITIPELIEKLESDDHFTLVDNRTWEEHIGEISGYSYHDEKGRIPGSVFGYAGYSDAYSLEYYRNPDQTMRNPKFIQALWESQGINTENHLAFMCGSGWRAAEVYYYARVMGLDYVSIYSDGWIGWSMEGDRPFETDEP